MTEHGPEAGRVADALTRLDAITRRLRVECPWDRRQDERSIVPHTVEEAYELADAAASGDDVKLLDELGDMLFQVYFLALLLEERGAGDLAAVAEQITAKLIRRHPHIFEQDAEGQPRDVDADTVLSNWDRIKREQEGRSGLFADVPENLPALLHARKLQRRALNRAGADADLGFTGAGDAAPAVAALRRAADALQRQAGARAAAPEGEPFPDRDQIDRELGGLLFAAVDIGRRLSSDPELALRGASARFQAGAVECEPGPGEHQ